MTFPALQVEASFSATSTALGSYLYWDDPVRGKYDSGNVWAASDIWATITDYVREISIDRGSQRFDGPNVQYEAGHATLVLDNTDRRFDPTNTTGPYAVAGVSNVRPMRSIRIRAVYGSNMLTDPSFETMNGWFANANTTLTQETIQVLRGRYAARLTSLAAGDVSAYFYSKNVTPSGTYTAMAWFKSAAVVRSAQAWVYWYDASGVNISATAAGTITTTTTGWTQASGTVTAPSNAYIAVFLVAVRNTLGAGEVHYVDKAGLFEGSSQTWTPNPIAYELFRGYVDSWPVTWDGPNESIATVSCTDATKVLSNYESPAQTLQGAGEDAGARISRILDNAGWSSSDRLIYTGNTTVQATDLAGNAWDLLQLTADSEAGELFINAQGIVVFRSRQATLTATLSKNSQATFGDGAGELGYLNGSAALDYDDTQISNIVRITRVGGVQQSVSDASSISQYLNHTYSVDNLVMQTDAVALDYANYVLHQRKDPDIRFSTISIEPQTDPENLWEQALGREFADRITINRRPPGGGTISRDVFIRGIHHVIQPQFWQTTWDLENATKYDEFLIYDDPARGKWDTGRWGF